MGVWYIWGYGTYGGVVHMGVWYIWGCGTYGGVVHMGVWYIWGYGTYGGVVHMGVWYIWGCGTYGGVVHMGVWYIWHMSSNELMDAGTVKLHLCSYNDGAEKKCLLELTPFLLHTDPANTSGIPLEPVRVPESDGPTHEKQD